MRGISVIIPTLNRKVFLMNTIKDLMQQDYDGKFEIIIVDQSSEIDNECRHLAEHSNNVIRYFYITEFKGLPEARNFGVSKATYEYTLFLDDDIECCHSLLSEHIKCLDKEGVAIVAGGITEKFKSNVDVKRVGYFDFWTATPYRGFHMRQKGFVDHGGGGNYSILTSVFKQVGGTDEYLNYGAALYEESEVCLRVKALGYKVFYNHEAHVYHLAADTGGCRVIDVKKYVNSMVHNRALVISRHLSWYHKPVAILVLLKLVMAYAVNSKNPLLFGVFINAYRMGAKKARLIPKNSFLV